MNSTGWDRLMIKTDKSCSIL